MFLGEVTILYNYNFLYMKKTAVLWAWNIAWAIVILILCALPKQDIPDPNLDIPYLDKVIHFGMFFIMALLLCRGIEYRSSFNLKKTLPVVVIIVSIYGGLIELMQHYFFHRSGDVWDLFADVLGAIAGCLSYPTVKQVFAGFRNRHKKEGRKNSPDRWSARVNNKRR